MSYHVLHVLQHGSVLSKERGFIVCKGQEGPERKLPHEDIRAVVIAARGVTLTSHFVSAITESDGIILHCNESYQPCGITTPLARVTDHRAYLSQASRPVRLNNRLWQHLMRGKTANQRKVLQMRGTDSPHLERALRTDHIDEGNCARQYWQLYFPSIGWAASGRDRKIENPPNAMLNYGYTVLSALCHRSLLIHGLTPLLGVKHTTRYRAHPMVYDLMEPFRPMVDLMLAEFMVQPDVSMKAWCKKIGAELRERRLSHERYSLKLMDAVDVSASSLARSYADRSPDRFWVPEL